MRLLDLEIKKQNGCLHQISISIDSSISHEVKSKPSSKAKTKTWLFIFKNYLN